MLSVLNFVAVVHMIMLVLHTCTRRSQCVFGTGLESGLVGGFHGEEGRILASLSTVYVIWRLDRNLEPGRNSQFFTNSSKRLSVMEAPLTVLHTAHTAPPLYSDQANPLMGIQRRFPRTSISCTINVLVSLTRNRFISLLRYRL